MSRRFRVILLVLTASAVLAIIRHRVIVAFEPRPYAEIEDTTVTSTPEEGYNRAESQ